MKGVTQPVGPPRLLAMFGRYAVLVGVPDRSHDAAAGPAVATPYGTSVSRTASSAVRASTPGRLRPRHAVIGGNARPFAAQLGINGGRVTAAQPSLGARS